MVIGIRERNQPSTAATLHLLKTSLTKPKTNVGVATKKVDCVTLLCCCAALMRINFLGGGNAL